MEVTKPDTSYATAVQPRPVPSNGGGNGTTSAVREPVTPAPRPAASAVAEPKTVTEPSEIYEAVDELQSAIESFDRKLNFSVDEGSGRFSVKVIDTSTDEVIREIPPENVLKIVAHFKELIGLLFDETV